MAPGAPLAGLATDGLTNDDKLVQERLGDELRERAHKCGTVAPGEEPLCDSALRLTCARSSFVLTCREYFLGGCADGSVPGQVVQNGRFGP